jgi:hypothetical protein
VDPRTRKTSSRLVQNRELRKSGPGAETGYVRRMETVKPRTVYAVLLTFEEKGKLSQRVELYSLKGNASSLHRAFVSAITRDDKVHLYGAKLEQFKVVPVLDDNKSFLATHAVALTWEGENGVEQTIELFERSEDAEAARFQHEQAFADGSGPGRLVALTCAKTTITAPISEGDAPFRAYMDAVRQLGGR